MEWGPRRIRPGDRQLDHLGRGVDADDPARRDARGELGGHLAVAAADVEHRLAARQVELGEQLARPDLLLRGVARVIAGVPGVRQHADLFAVGAAIPPAGGVPTQAALFRLRSATLVESKISSTPLTGLEKSIAAGKIFVSCSLNHRSKGSCDAAKPSLPFAGSSPSM